MTLRSLMNADIATVFLNEDEFAETIIFSAPWSGGPRSISALVGERELDNSNSQLGNSDMETVTILVANNATTGIDRAAIGSTIEFGSDTEPDPKKRVWVFKEQMDCDDFSRSLKFQRIKLREIVNQASQFTP